MQWMIQAAAAKTLPLPHRLAWACSVVARVGSFFSQHARSKYYLDNVTVAVWDWTQKGRSARERCRRLLTKLNKVDGHFDFPAVSDAELDEEGYSHGFATLGVCLLNEMDRDDGGPASTAVFTAAQCYAAHVLYRQGVGHAEGFLDLDFLTELARPAHDFARRAFDTARAQGDGPVQRGRYDELPFDATVPRVDRAVLTRVRTRPPAAEVEFLRATGRYVG